MLRRQLNRVRQEAAGLMTANSELRQMILDLEDNDNSKATKDEITLREIVRALEDTVGVQQKDYQSLEADLEEVYQDYSNETIALEGKLEAAERMIRSYEQIFFDLGVAPPKGDTEIGRDDVAGVNQESPDDERDKQAIEQGIQTIQDWLDESGPSPWPMDDDDDLLTEKASEDEGATEIHGDSNQSEIDSEPQRWGHSRTLTESFKSMNELGLE